MTPTKTRICWRDRHALRRLIACIWLACNGSLDFKKISQFFGYGTTYHSIEGQFRHFRQLADEIQAENRDLIMNVVDDRNGKKRKRRNRQADDTVSTEDSQSTHVAAECASAGLNQLIDPGRNSPAGPHREQQRGESNIEGDEQEWTRASKRRKEEKREETNRREEIRRGKQRAIDVVDLVSDKDEEEEEEEEEEEKEGDIPFLNLASRRRYEADEGRSFSHVSSPPFRVVISRRSSITMPLNSSQSPQPGPSSPTYPCREEYGPVQLEGLNEDGRLDHTDDSSTGPNAMLQLNEELATFGVQSSPIVYPNRGSNVWLTNSSAAASSSSGPADGLPSLKRGFSDTMTSSRSATKQDDRDFTAYALNALDGDGNIRPEFWKGVGRRVTRGWWRIDRSG